MYISNVVVIYEELSVHQSWCTILKSNRKVQKSRKLFPKMESMINQNRPYLVSGGMGLNYFCK